MFLTYLVTYLGEGIHTRLLIIAYRYTYTSVFLSYTYKYPLAFLAYTDKYPLAFLAYTDKYHDTYHDMLQVTTHTRGAHYCIPGHIPRRDSIYPSRALPGYIPVRKPTYPLMSLCNSVCLDICFSLGLHTRLYPSIVG